MLSIQKMRESVSKKLNEYYTSRDKSWFFKTFFEYS